MHSNTYPVHCLVAEDGDREDPFRHRVRRHEGNSIGRAIVLDLGQFLHCDKHQYMTSSAGFCLFPDVRYALSRRVVNEATVCQLMSGDWLAHWLLMSLARGGVTECNAVQKHEDHGWWQTTSLASAISGGWFQFDCGGPE